MILFQEHKKNVHSFISFTTLKRMSRFEGGGTNPPPLYSVLPCLCRDSKPELDAAGVCPGVSGQHLSRRKVRNSPGTVCFRLRMLVIREIVCINSIERYYSKVPILFYHKTRIKIESKSDRFIRRLTDRLVYFWFTPATPA